VPWAAAALTEMYGWYTTTNLNGSRNCNGASPGFKLRSYVAGTNSLHRKNTMGAIKAITAINWLAKHTGYAKVV